MRSSLAMREWTWVRSCLLIVFLSVATPLLLITCLATRFPLAVTLIIVAAGVLALPSATRFLPGKLAHDRAHHRFLFVSWVALSLFVSVRLTTLSAFMLDARKVQFAVDSTIQTVWRMVDPESREPTHNCFTAGAIAARLATQDVENIYDRNHYFAPSGAEAPFRAAIRDRFTVDPFQYPPPFLILPGVILAFGSDFLQARTYWFVLNVLVCAAAMVVLATWVGGFGFNAYWLIWPMVIGTPAMLRTLQTGNAHLLVVSLSLLAMVAFEARRERLGGALLAFACVSKVFPGVLLAFLLVQKRWTAVLWTVVGMAALCLTAMALFGVQPLESFVGYQVPRLVSGEAFDFARKTTGMSVVSMPYKLDGLGILPEFDAGNVAAVIAWLYTVVLVVAIGVAGTKNPTEVASARTTDQGRSRRLVLAEIWLVLLTLAQLRSPFLPWGYSNAAVLWLLALAILSSERKPWSKGLLLAGWIVFAVNVPASLGIEGEAFKLGYTLVVQLLLVSLSLTFVLRQARFHGILRVGRHATL